MQLEIIIAYIGLAGTILSGGIVIGKLMSRLKAVEARSQKRDEECKAHDEDSGDVRDRLTRIETMLKPIYDAFINGKQGGR